MPRQTYATNPYEDQRTDLVNKLPETLPNFQKKEAPGKFWKWAAGLSLTAAAVLVTWHYGVPLVRNAADNLRQPTSQQVRQADEETAQKFAQRLKNTKFTSQSPYRQVEFKVEGTRIVGGTQKHVLDMETGSYGTITGGEIISPTKARYSWRYHPGLYSGLWKAALVDQGTSEIELRPDGSISDRRIDTPQSRTVIFTPSGTTEAVPSYGLNPPGGAATQPATAPSATTKPAATEPTTKPKMRLPPMGRATPEMMEEALKPRPKTHPAASAPTTKPATQPATAPALSPIQAEYMQSMGKAKALMEVAANAADVKTYEEASAAYHSIYDNPKFDLSQRSLALYSESRGYLDAAKMLRDKSARESDKRDKAADETRSRTMMSKALSGFRQVQAEFGGTDWADDSVLGEGDVLSLQGNKRAAQDTYRKLFKSQDLDVRNQAVQRFRALN
jgi:hypothetical protein